MRLVTYRKGASKPKLGALVDDAVLDLAALAADLARERGTVRRGRDGFPRTVLDLIAAGTEGLGTAREVLEHGTEVLKHLDEEQDVGRHRVRRPVRVRAWTQQRHIWLGLGVFLQEFDGVLDLDDGTLPQPPRPEMSEVVHRAGVPRADRLGADDLPRRELDRPRPWRGFPPGPPTVLPPAV